MIQQAPIKGQFFLILIVFASSCARATVFAQQNASNSSYSIVSGQNVTTTIVEVNITITTSIPVLTSTTTARPVVTNAQQNNGTGSTLANKNNAATTLASPLSLVSRRNSTFTTRNGTLLETTTTHSTMIISNNDSISTAVYNVTMVTSSTTLLDISPQINQTLKPTGLPDDTTATTLVPKTLDSDNGGDVFVLTDKVMKQYFIAILIIVIFCFVFICIVLIVVILTRKNGNSNSGHSDNYAPAESGEISGDASGYSPRPVEQKDNATNTSFPIIPPSMTNATATPPVPPRSSAYSPSPPYQQQENINRESASYPRSPPLPPPPTAIRVEFPLVSLGDDLSQRNEDLEIEETSGTSSETNPNEEYLPNRASTESNRGSLNVPA